MSKSTTKVCPGCGETNLTAFTIDRRKKDGLDTYCRACKKKKRESIPRDVAQGYQNTYRRKDPEKTRQRYRRQYANNPEAAARRQRTYRDRHREEKGDGWTLRQRKMLLKSHGLTLETYAELLENQGYTCAICGSDNPIHWSNKFVVDHCHTTHRVRGLLCSNCNRGLGLFGDDPERLLAAAAYLTQDWCE